MAPSPRTRSERDCCGDADDAPPFDHRLVPLRSADHNVRVRSARRGVCMCGCTHRCILDALLSQLECYAAQAGELAQLELVGAEGLQQQQQQQQQQLGRKFKLFRFIVKQAAPFVGAHAQIFAEVAHEGGCGGRYVLFGGRFDCDLPMYRLFLSRNIETQRPRPATWSGGCSMSGRECMGWRCVSVAAAARQHSRRGWPPRKRPSCCTALGARCRPP
eukprot:COSAG01_NODE_348_length_18498_cov_181.563128_19_plen_217_part_00